MKVSIIIPTYNYAQYIVKAIQSVWQQSYPKHLIEVIVVDDGSTDDTAVVLQPLITSGSIQYYHQANSGKAAATAKAFEFATGEVICNLDADDTFLPDKIATIVKLFTDFPGLAHVAAPALIQFPGQDKADIVEKIPAAFLGKQLHGRDLLHHFMDHKMLFGGGSTFCARASVLKKMAMPPAIDMYTDEWLVIKVLLAGDTYFWPTALSTWQVHGNNYSVKKQDKKTIILKNERLLNASHDIMQALQNGAYPPWLQKAYLLKHEVRKMGWQEVAGTKTWSDRLQFAKFCLLKHRFPVKWWMAYRLINRILY